MTVVWLKVLGVVLEIHCHHERCANEILEFMGALALPPKLRHTPDWRFDISLESFNRYLHRERPDELEGTPLAGVKYMRPGDKYTSDWTSRLPPLVPFHHPTNQERFVGLHAACVNIEGIGCIVFPGDRGNGKTTVSTLLCRNHSAALLTDESTFLYRRTKVVEPLAFALGIHTHGPDQPKKLVSAQRECGSLATNPGIVACVCFLSHDKNKSSLTLVSEGEALRGLFHHQLDVGSSWNESITTFAAISNGIPIYKITWRKFEDIPGMVKKFTETIGISNTQNVQPSRN